MNKDYLITKVRINKGKPLVVKDNICTKGIQTTAGSKILEGYIPTFDATAVARLKKKGYSVVGKATQDEFGFGTFSTNCAYGIPKNPYDFERTCGGSSGGVAGYVAITGTPGLGQSTGGSISCPASFCGVVGLAPTYGLVSRYGLIDYASSMDKIGPITKTVKESAQILTIIAGHDPKDSTSIQKPKRNYSKYIGKSVQGLRIGLPKEYFQGVDTGVKKSVLEAVAKLEKQGAKVVEISLPYTRIALPAYYIVAMCEASTNLAKFCGMKYGKEEKIKDGFNEYFSRIRTKNFGEEAKRRILLGTFARMAGFRDAYYLKALKIRTLIIHDFKKAFKKVDVLVSPTMPILPPKFSEIKKLKPLQQYQMDFLTIPVNFANLPHMSVPIGFINKLPVGVHIIADYFREDQLIQVGDAIERS